MADENPTEEPTEGVTDVPDEHASAEPVADLGDGIDDAALPEHLRDLPAEVTEGVSPDVLSRLAPGELPVGRAYRKGPPEPGEQPLRESPPPQGLVPREKIFERRGNEFVEVGKAGVVATEGFMPGRPEPTPEPPRRKESKQDKQARRAERKKREQQMYDRAVAAGVLQSTRTDQQKQLVARAERDAARLDDQYDVLLEQQEALDAQWEQAVATGSDRQAEELERQRHQTEAAIKQVEEELKRAHRVIEARQRQLAKKMDAEPSAEEKAELRDEVMLLLEQRDASIDVLISVARRMEELRPVFAQKLGRNHPFVHQGATLVELLGVANKLEQYRKDPGTRVGVLLYGNAVG